MSLSPPAPGHRARGLTAAPLDTISFKYLLASCPDLGVRIQTQAQAHCALLATRGIIRPPAEVITNWQRLITTHSPLPPPAWAEAMCGCVIAPEALALADPDDATRMVATLTPTQRAQQAAAQAAWLADFGYPVTLDQVLAGWGDLAERTV
jgi:hypothetical protein